jgi:rubrerythrin
MSQSDLESAFAGESQAHLRYLVYADKAEREGYPEVARLFRAVAHAEQVHATSHLRTLGKVGKTVENLQEGIDGEMYEVEEMYPAFMAVAETQEEKTALRSHSRAMEAEKVHAGFYARAKEAVETGEDVKLGQVYVCEVCGWTGEGEPPDECPLCGAKKDKFVVF